MIRSLLRTFGSSALATAAVALAWTGTAAAADAEAGKAIFVQNCASCHGETGKGDGPVGQALNPKPRDLSKGNFKFDTDGDGEAGTDTDITNVIKNGAAAYGGSALMAPWPTLDDEQIQDVIAYIRTLEE